MEFLNITDNLHIDDTITSNELHTHLPYASQTLNKNDEIRIPIHQQDIYTLPCKSFLYVEGSIRTVSVVAGVEAVVPASFVNNPVAFLFDEIRYEIGGVEVDRTRNLGITSTMKNLLSMRVKDKNVWGNSGWIIDTDVTAITEPEKFSFCVPLSMLLGFAEDYRKIILHVKQELVLLRSSTDNNAVQSINAASRATITLTSVQWRVPYVQVADSVRLQLLKQVDEDRTIMMPFRSWQIHEYPILPQTTNHSWTVRTTTQMEKPRFVALAFQTGRKNAINVINTKFDLCKLYNVRLYLNSVYYPYDNIMGNIRLLYEMFTNFQPVYYGEDESGTAISFTHFKEKTPIILIDCSKQNETLKTGTVDVRVEFQTKENMPANTTAYCLIIYDTVVEYTALSGMVRRVL